MPEKPGSFSCCAGATNACRPHAHAVRRLRLVSEAGVTIQASACDGVDSFAEDAAIVTGLAIAIAQALVQATAACASVGNAETSACLASNAQINAVAEATVCHSALHVVIQESCMLFRCS